MEKNKWIFLSFFVLIFTQVFGANHLKKVETNNSSDKCNAYLFVYFTGNRVDQEQIHFALSDDGYHYKALNHNHAVLSSKKISLSGGVRDPHILRCQDGKTFYMVATDMTSSLGWNSNRGIVLLKSKDLIHWSHKDINIPTLFPKEFGNVIRVWAPQTIYNPVTKKYMVYFSMLKSGKGEYDKIYYSYVNKDFTKLETVPKQLFYNPKKTACIDADIVYSLGEYHMFYKTEDTEKGIRQVVSKNVTGPWKAVGGLMEQTRFPVEGSCCFKLNNSNSWILMYDMYTQGRYQFTISKDMVHFKEIDQEVTMNFHPRHGTVMAITEKEANRLRIYWTSPDDVLKSAHAPNLRSNNIVINDTTHTVTFPIFSTTKLSDFHPEFKEMKGVSIKPAHPDFTKGKVVFTIKIGKKKTVKYRAIIVRDNNPVLNGYYADPEILYAKKTNKFYIYPTSDGFDGWSGTYFKCFSSSNLVNWKDEGKIIQLGKDVKWANRNAWAPCIVEKKMDGKYKYFFYFTAAQKIGVAVADNPTGPFVDSGKPLIATRPDGINWGQDIDPDVFTDPKTNKTYLYWGNGFMAGCELDSDMVSLNKKTLTILHPDHTFREGSYVFYRDGKYYFLWSQDDTRSVNYRVRYAISDSPLGKFTIPKNNLVIAKRPELGIYATGHCAVLQIPGKDEWYLVYHRFTYPEGIKMGGAAGFHREVCIDKMEFNADGTIKEVIPTQKGIQPVKLK